MTKPPYKITVGWHWFMWIGASEWIPVEVISAEPDGTGELHMLGNWDTVHPVEYAPGRFGGFIPKPEESS